MTGQDQFGVYSHYAMLPQECYTSFPSDVSLHSSSITPYPSPHTYYHLRLGQFLGAVDLC